MTYNIELHGRKHQLSFEPSANGKGRHVLLDGKAHVADAEFLEPGVLSLLIDGRSYRILYDPRPDRAAVIVGEHRLSYTVEDPRSLERRERTQTSDSGVLSVSAPMPGLILQLLVAVGDVVKANQGLMVMEAMKMQNELKAPRAGTVTRIAVEAGATVAAGKLLLVIE